MSAANKLKKNSRKCSLIELLAFHRLQKEPNAIFWNRKRHQRDQQYRSRNKGWKLKQAELLVELEKLKTNLYMFEKDLKFREDSSPTGIAKRMAKLHTELFACPECRKLTLKIEREIREKIKKEGTIEEQFRSTKLVISTYNQDLLNNLVAKEAIVSCPSHDEMAADYYWLVANRK